MVVYNIDTDFPLNMMKLGEPSAMQGGGSYTASITINDEPIRVQLPKCTTKSGIVETQRNKYCDLMYINSEYNLSEWIKQLEEKCINLIDDKKHLWFSNTLSKSDIKGMMTPVSREYKSGSRKLLRIQIGTKHGYNNVKSKFFDENKQPVDISCIDTNTSVIPLLILEGIHFTSRSIDIIFKLHQMMILEKNNIDDCLIQVENKVAETLLLDKQNDNIENDVIENDVIENDNIENDVIENDNIENDNIENVELIVNTPNDELFDDYVNNKEEDIQSISNEDLDMNDNSSNMDKYEDDDEIINIDIEELNSNNDEINEIEIDINDNDESITLKRPNEVYYEIYKAAIDKAKHMRKVAIEAYLEAQQIKTKYMIIDDNDENNEENSEDIIFKDTDI